MTRADILREVTAELGEVSGTPAGEDPFSLNRQIQSVVDEIARDTFCFYTVRTTSLVAAQVDYCIPELFRFGKAVVVDAQSQDCHLTPMPDWKASNRLGSNWRNATAQDPPNVIVYTAVASNFSVYPPPLTSRTSALKLSGWYAPGTVWAYDGSGNALPITDASVMPLPSYAEEAVLLGVKTRRCLQFIADDQKARQYPEYKAQYIKAKRRVEALAKTFYRSQYGAQGGR